MRGLNKKDLIKMFYLMSKIRIFEEKIVSLYSRQDMRTPVHLYIGEEAIAVGVCMNLSKNDFVFGTHRSHGLYIAKGGDLKKLAAELYGRRTGCSKGKGGSMHVVDTKVGVCGTTAIVGGNIPLAVGAALAIKMKKQNYVSCAFFGDGAVDEGTFYESLNFAALKKLPVIFICENNFYATHSHISKRQPFDNIYERSIPLGVPSFRVDGNDVLSIYSLMKDLIFKVRKEKTPFFVECRTYRWKTHVGPQSDDLLGNPAGRDLADWMRKCPIKRIKKFLLKNNILSQEDMKGMVRKIKEEVKAAFVYGRNSPFPSSNDLYKDVVEEK